LDIDISLPEKFPDGGARLEIVFLSSGDMPLAKYKAARTKLRELCKDSGLTVTKFLEMKYADLSGNYRGSPCV
jgi:hypothetical protein